MDVQPTEQGVSWSAVGAESTPVPAFEPEPLTWAEANRQASREKRRGGHDWRWWDRRRRELAGWPKERRRQRANRAAWVDVLAEDEARGRTRKKRDLMEAWDARRDELLDRDGGGWP